MTYPEDPRLSAAKARPIAEIADRLAIPGLRKSGREMTGPCPVCGGRDRFSINISKGVFQCRICQAKGDGLALVAHVLGCDFPGALSWLEGDRVEVSAEEMERRRARLKAAEEKAARDAAQYREWARADAVKIWRRAEGRDRRPVLEYLEARGISLPVLPAAFRFLPDHPYVKKIGGRLETLHRGPCIIAAVQGRDDRLSAVHQTWINLDNVAGDFKAEIFDPAGARCASKMVRGAKKGGAIRLGSTGQSRTLIMGEGTETTLSARVCDPVGPAHYWAGVDLGNMAGIMEKIPGKRWSGLPDLSDLDAFIPPPWCARLIYIRDGDSEKNMTLAKLNAGLLRAAHHVPGLICEIVDPGDGRDLNELLRGQK